MSIWFRLLVECKNSIHTMTLGIKFTKLAEIILTIFIPQNKLASCQIQKACNHYHCLQVSVNRQVAFK